MNEVTAWQTISALLSMLLLGIVLGARLFKPAKIEIRQEQHQQAAGGAASVTPARADRGGGGGALLPLLMIASVAIVALAATASATDQASDIAQRSIDAQQEMVRAWPTPVIIEQPAPVIVEQPEPVVIEQPATRAPQALGLEDVTNIATVAAMLLTTVMIAALIVYVIYRKIQMRREDRRAADELARGLFSAAAQNVARRR